MKITALKTNLESLLVKKKICFEVLLQFSKENNIYWNEPIFHIIVYLLFIIPFCNKAGMWYWPTPVFIL